MYDHDLEEVEELGWEEFITRQWESIFVGYRSWTGRRALGRRWGDLIEAGLGCPQDVADQLVREQIIYGPDRGLESLADGQDVVTGMVGVLADLRAGLIEMAELGYELMARLLDAHARLLSYIRVLAFGQED
jgi:hypothetical protein